jgi:hypothetical protein
MSAELFRILVVFIWLLAAAYGYSSGNQLDHACSLLVTQDYFNFLVSAVQYMDVSCIPKSSAVPQPILRDSSGRVTGFPAAGAAVTKLLIYSRADWAVTW